MSCASTAQVVGVEAIPEAIDALRSRFPHLALPEEPQLGAHDGFERYISGDLAIYRGNFFQLSPAVLSLAGPIAWVWDRAGLEVVPQEVRPGSSCKLDLLAHRHGVFSL